MCCSVHGIFLLKLPVVIVNVSCKFCWVPVHPVRKRYWRLYIFQNITSNKQLQLYSNVINYRFIFDFLAKWSEKKVGIFCDVTWETKCLPMAKISRQPLQYYRHNYAKVFMTGLLGCRWHRYKQSTKGSNKVRQVPMCWFLFLLISVFSLENVEGMLHLQQKFWIQEVFIGYKNCLQGTFVLHNCSLASC